MTRRFEPRLARPSTGSSATTASASCCSDGPTITTRVSITASRRNCRRLGYPVFSQHTLPLDDDLLERLFGDEVRSGLIRHPLDISDVWKNSLAASSNLKIWAAKFAARHPNLVAVELSNFKCGHDAPIYATIEEIIEASGTPYFGFKDIDENKPAGAIKLRLETIDYSLKRAREVLLERGRRTDRIERWLTAYEKRLRKQMTDEPPSDEPIQEIRL